MKKIILPVVLVAAAMGLTSLGAQTPDQITIVTFDRGALVDGYGTVSLGLAGGFSVLTMNGDFSDSGPTGPDAHPHTIAGDVGVNGSGHHFSASGSVIYGGQVLIHSGSTYNNSAPGVPPPTMGPEVDQRLEQATADAMAASAAALALPPTATYGTINNNFTISQNNTGNFVFDITGVNFSGGKVLTLSAPAGSTFILNISSQLVLTSGTIRVAGGLTAADVLINYTGTSNVRFSGGGNVSRVDGTILAPNAGVQISPGFVGGSVIAQSISMSSGADVVPEPSTNVLFVVGAGVVVSGLVVRRKKFVPRR